MSTQIQQGSLLDVLKKKMRQSKEETEKYKDECEEFQKRLQGEVLRREDVSSLFFFVAILELCFLIGSPDWKPEIRFWFFNYDHY